MVDSLLIATSGGLEDPFLELEDRPFALRPGNGLPFIYRPRGRSHDVWTPTHRASVPLIGPTSAYPGHYPSALASWAILPTIGMRATPTPRIDHRGELVVGSPVPDVRALEP